MIFGMEESSVAGNPNQEFVGFVGNLGVVRDARVYESQDNDDQRHGMQLYDGSCKAFFMYILCAPRGT